MRGSFPQEKARGTAGSSKRKTRYIPIKRNRAVKTVYTRGKVKAES